MAGLCAWGILFVLSAYLVRLGLRATDGERSAVKVFGWIVTALGGGLVVLLVGELWRVLRA